MFYFLLASNICCRTCRICLSVKVFVIYDIKRAIKICKKICLETSQWKKKKQPEEFLKASDKQAKIVDTRDVDIWVQSKARGGRQMKDAGPDSHL